MKLHFLFDKTKKAKFLKKKIQKYHQNFSIKSAEIIVVGGGDGFMLQSLKKYSIFNKPFYGINCGSFGFLLNKFNFSNLEKKIKNSKKILINPLEINFKKNKKRIIAINEISLFRQSKQTTSLKILINKKIIVKKLIGDGVLISTPAGSTAYNSSANGPILSLNSGKLAITPISPFRPRKWKSKIISNKSVINIENLNPKKRPIAAVADNIEIRNIKKLSVKINNKIKLILLYDRNHSLEERINLEKNKY